MRKKQQKNPGWAWFTTFAIHYETLRLTHSRALFPCHNNIATESFDGLFIFQIATLIFILIWLTIALLAIRHRVCFSQTSKSRATWKSSNFLSQHSLGAGNFFRFIFSNAISSCVCDNNKLTESLFNITQFVFRTKQRAPLSSKSKANVLRCINNPLWCVVERKVFG